MKNVIREMQIGTTARYPCAWVSTAEVENKEQPEMLADQHQGSIAAGGSARRRFLQKQNILHYSPGILLLSIYHKEVTTSVHPKTCTWVRIAALFIIAQTWTQPGCPSISDRINKLWPIQTTEYYSRYKRNELTSREAM